MLLLRRAQRESASPFVFRGCVLLGRERISMSVIVKDPDILGGEPVFRGTRVPFRALLDYLEGGETLDEFLDDFPTVSREAAIAALERAKTILVGQLE